jgi:hypothetical protein
LKTTAAIERPATSDSTRTLVTSGRRRSIRQPKTTSWAIVSVEYMALLREARGRRVKVRKNRSNGLRPIPAAGGAQAVGGEQRGELFLQVAEYRGAVFRAQRPRDDELGQPRRAHVHDRLRVRSSSSPPTSAPAEPVTPAAPPRRPRAA